MDRKRRRHLRGRRSDAGVFVAAGLLLAIGCSAPRGSAAPETGGGDAASPPTDAARPGTPTVRRATPHRPYLPLPPVADLPSKDADGAWIDPVRALAERIEDGDVEFTYDSVVGYLPSLLAALDIPISSQGLVFSRTSLQANDISPWSPRALYFNDDVYVGYVVESDILEVAAIDPDDGAVFYILPQDSTRTTFQEDRSCLGCHDASVTLDVPGVMLRSTFADRMGWAVAPLSERATTDRTPMAERYAGYYVTGTMERGRHAGNTRAEREVHELDPSDFETFDFGAANDIEYLPPPFVEREVYLSDHSDIVAWLVLTHQTTLHNVLTLLHEGVEDAMRNQRAAVITRGVEVPDGGLLPATEAAIASKVDRLVREMFFVREADLGGPIRGTTTFARDFSARGPRDSAGRSLRDFDLDRRLFRYPFSFLVYSDAFAALPPSVVGRVYDGVDAVLTGEDRREDFAHLDDDTRRAIREILLETKPDFAQHVGAAGARPEGAGAR